MPFSSMYIGASGINAHGSWMDVIGNNLANANTIAYKGSQALFGTLMSETLPGGVRYEGGTNAFPSQKGLGVGVSEIRMDISQGSFEPGETATDLAIGGQGYFRVVNGADNTAFYTRAGNFRFDREGLLVDPHGFALQGWMLDQDGAHVGSTTDIRLPMVTETVDGHEIQVVKSDPRATGAITLSVNLDSTSADRTSDPGNPFFSLLGAYDGRSEPPLSTDAAIYQTSIDVYDAEGVKSHPDRVLRPGGRTRGHRRPAVLRIHRQRRARRGRPGGPGRHLGRGPVHGRHPVLLGQRRGGQHERLHPRLGRGRGEGPRQLDPGRSGRRRPSAARRGLRLGRRHRRGPDHQPGPGIVLRHGQLVGPGRLKRRRRRLRRRPSGRPGRGLARRHVGHGLRHAQRDHPAEPGRSMPRATCETSTSPRTASWWASSPTAWRRRSTR